MLAQDIDATGYSGFTPIGLFSGTFNGLGNVVANLTINSSASFAGLFGQSSGTIENIGLIGGSVTDNAAGALVGGLVGDASSGTISNVYTTGTVTDGGPGSWAGGLVGENQATIENSYTTGTVTGTRFTGGLVGENQGTVQYAYSTATVSGTGQFVGGLIGFDGGLVTQDVYAAGPVSGSGADVGGLIGEEVGIVTNGYWDSDRSTGVNSAATAVGFGTSSGITTLTGADAFTLSSYAGFIPSTTPGATGNNWVIVDTDGSLNNASGTGATLPMLASEYQTTIQNAHQLQLMVMNVNANYTLGRNIDATATGSSTGFTTGTDVWGAGGFVPVGGNANSAYSGTFNGADNTIADLTINNVSAGIFGTIGGLFGQLGSGGTISNVGALAGVNNGTITNVQSSVPVTGFFQVGGLVGDQLGGSITNSSSSGVVTGEIVPGSTSSGNPGPIGGLVGELDAGSITGSSATGAVTALDGDSIGGLIGLTNAGTTVTLSFATGNVNAIPLTNGGVSIGGLIGLNDSVVTESFATGAVTGEQFVGGLIGDNDSGGGHQPILFATGSGQRLSTAPISSSGSTPAG